MRKRFIAVIMLITLVSTSVEALAQSKVSVNSTAVIQGLKDMMSPSGKFLSVEMADGTSFSTAPTTGIGDVVGPASSVENRVVFFADLTGKLIKDSGILLSGSNTGDNAANSSTTYVGTTAIPLNRASAAQALTGITSIDSPVLGVPEVLGGITTAAGDGQTLEIGGYINSPFLQAGEFQNYLLYSESFAQSLWVKTLIGTVTANSAVSPLGTTVAENIPAGSGPTASISQTITNSSTGDWTLSVWLKAQSGVATIGLSIDSSAETGTVKNINLTTTWRRYFVTQNFVLANTTKTVYITNGTNAIAAWGAQLEPSTYPRRYVGYDTGTAVTILTRNVYSPIQISAGGGVVATNTSITTRNAIATNSTEGILNYNPTVATAGVPVQMSPRLRFSGTAWETTGGTSKTVNGIVEVLPTTGASASASMDFSIDPGTGSYTKCMSIAPTGVVLLAGRTFSILEAYTDASNYSNLKLYSDSSGYNFKADQLGTGIANRPFIFNQDSAVTGKAWDFQVNGTSKIYWDASGKSFHGTVGDSTGTPGNATLNTVTGKSAIAAASNNMTLTNSNIAATSLLHITPLDIDVTAMTWKYSVAAGVGTVTVNAAATANLRFSWHVIN